MVINFLWYILKMGQNNIFVSGGGGGVEGGMVTVQLTLPPLVLNLMTESSSSHFVLTPF